MRHLHAIQLIVVVSALVATACTDAPRDDGATATATAPAPTDPPVAEGRSCASPDGFVIAYPEGWEAVADCGMFGPAPVEEPEQGTDERPGVVSAHVDEVAFSEVAAPAPQEVDRAVTVVDGLQAVRRARVEDGRGLYPAGTRTVQWVVDLAVGPDDGPGTLIVSAVDAGHEDRFETAVMTMDAMVRTLDVAAAADVSDQVVARLEGGGIPLTVAASGSASTPATCFRLLRADTDPVCLDPPEAEPFRTGALPAPDGDAVTVGLTGPEFQRAELTSRDGSVAALTVPVVARDLRAFALPVPPEDVSGVEVFPHAGPPDG